MSHVRTRIRAWALDALRGSADAGDRVRPRRALPEAKALQPTFHVFVEREQAQDLTMDECQLRIVTLRVAALVKEDEAGAEDILDRMGLHAERAFALDPKLGGLAQEYEYQGAEFSVAGNGERNLAVAQFIFAVSVATERHDPETAL